MKIFHKIRKVNYFILIHYLLYIYYFGSNSKNRVKEILSKLFLKLWYCSSSLMNVLLKYAKRGFSLNFRIFF